MHDERDDERDVMMRHSSNASHRHGAGLAAVVTGILVASIHLVEARGASPLEGASPMEAVKARIAEIAGAAAGTVDEAGRVTAVMIPDGSAVTAEDITLFGRLPDLERLEVLNCRSFDDAMAASLAASRARGGLARLRSLSITNSGLTDEGVAVLAAAFPDLVELDLSSNTNLTGAAMRSIASLGKLERLSLLQNRFNDLHTRRLAKVADLVSLDLRGNMEAGDMTLEVIGSLPKLRALKHRSSIVSDAGIEGLAASRTLESLLMQDFGVTSRCGESLGRIGTLTSLEIFRCQGFGSEGVLALAGLPLDRLTLRDLPDVGDDALAVVARLPKLRRLYLHELASVGDAGIDRLSAATNLAVLDIWSLPGMTDASIDVIAALPKLRELSIRETGVSEAALGTILAMPGLESLTFKNNGTLSEAARARVRERKWKKLDLGE
jgi:hypothetical protein